MEFISLYCVDICAIQLLVYFVSWLIKWRLDWLVDWLINPLVHSLNQTSVFMREHDLQTWQSSHWLFQFAYYEIHMDRCRDAQWIMV